jgi:hypothetical protein
VTDHHDLSFDHYEMALVELGNSPPADGDVWPTGNWARGDWHLRRALALEGLERTRPPQGGRPADGTGPDPAAISPLAAEQADPHESGPSNRQRGAQRLPDAAVGDLIHPPMTDIPGNVITLQDASGHTWHRNDDPQFGSLEHTWYRLGIPPESGTKVTHRDHTVNLIRYCGPLTVTEVRSNFEDRVERFTDALRAPSPTRHAAERMRAQLDEVRELAEEAIVDESPHGVHDSGAGLGRRILAIIGDPYTPPSSTQSDNSQPEPSATETATKTTESDRIGSRSADPDDPRRVSGDAVNILRRISE